MKKIEIDINTQEIMLNHRLGCNTINTIYFNKLKNMFENQLNDIFHDAIISAKNLDNKVDVK